MDAALVMQKDKAQDVKKVVELLKIIFSGRNFPKIIGLGDGLKVCFGAEFSSRSIFVKLEQH